MPGVIDLRTFLGPFTRFHVHVNDDTTLTADIPSQHAHGFVVNQQVQLTFPPDACQVLPIDDRGHELRELAEAEKVL
jgi:putative spermidine/putrescine transport system ATP-binding protein